MTGMQDPGQEGLSGYWGAVTGEVSRWSWADIIFSDEEMGDEDFSHFLSGLDVPAPLLRRFHLKFSFPTYNVGLFGGQAPALQDLELRNTGVLDWGFLTTSTLRNLVLGQVTHPGIPSQLLASLLRTNRRLEMINLTGVVLAATAVTVRNATLIKFPKLKTLILDMIDLVTLAPLLELLQLPALTHFFISSFSPPPPAVFVAIRTCLTHTFTARASTLRIDPIPSRLSILPESVGLRFGPPSTPLIIQLEDFDASALLENCVLPLLELPYPRETAMAIDMECSGDMDQTDFVEYLWRLPQTISLQVQDAIAAWGDVDGLIDGLVAPGREEREGQWLLPKLSNFDLTGGNGANIARIQQMLQSREAAHLAGGEGAPEKLSFCGMVQG